MVDVATKNRLTTAGIFSSAEVVEGLFNSRGVADWYEQTLAEVSITMLANVVRMAEGQLADAAQLDHAATGRDCRAKSHRTREIRIELPPGKYTVVLEPAAVLDAVGFMFWDFGERRCSNSGRF